MVLKGICGLLMLCSLEANAIGKAFKLNDLPVGKSVTLPHPALTLVPADQSVTLTSTDMPQTIKMTIDKANRKASVKVAIYDSHGDVVRYLNVATGVSTLYSFKALSSIRLVPQEKGHKKGVHLLIESNKPLGITR